jgi:hypothetical protein
MLIHQPTVEERDGEVRVAARIDTTRGERTLWFAIPAAHGEAISDRADAFVAAALPVAMVLGEDLEVRGRISPRLIHGTRQYQQVLAVWGRGGRRMVEVHGNEVEAPRANERAAWVASSFSGGVDSFYTLWRHHGARAEPLAEYRITHALFVNGFDNDFDLEDAGLFRALRAAYQPLFTALGIEPLFLRSNMRPFRRGIIGPWGAYLYFGSALSAFALSLGRRIARYYLPGARAYADLVPDGSHPLLDHHMSTEATESIYDGGEATRAEKIAVLTGWPETWTRLRVCSNPDRYNIDLATGAVDNCGECEKCLLTMTALDLLGALPRYTSFPRPLSRRRLRTMPLDSGSVRARAREYLALAAKANRRDLVFDLRAALVRSRVLHAATGLRRRARAVLERVVHEPGGAPRG